MAISNCGSWRSVNISNITDHPQVAEKTVEAKQQQEAAHAAKVIGEAKDYAPPVGGDAKSPAPTDAESIRQETDRLEQGATSLNAAAENRIEESFPDIPGMDVTRGADGVNTVHIQPSRTGDRLMERMDQGPVDLSRPTEWGKFSHGASEEVLEGIDPSAQSEKHVTWTDASGQTHRGRIDSLTDTQLWDFKTGDLSLKTESQLNYELNRIDRQLENYVNADGVPKGLEKVVFFEKQPADPLRVEKIEAFFKDKHVTVMWGNL